MGNLSTRTSAALLGLLLFAGAAAAQDPEPLTVYEVDAPLMPFCLDGAFPLRVEISGGQIPGTLTVTTDVKGKLTGTWDTPSFGTFEAKGTARYKDGVGTLKLALTRPHSRISLKGTLAEPGFD